MSACGGTNDCDVILTLMSISDLTTEKLRELIAEVVEEKLLELLGDPDAGLDVRDDVRERLLRSRAAVERGASTVALEKLAEELGVTER